MSQTLRALLLMLLTGAGPALAVTADSAAPPAAATTVLRGELSAMLADQQHPLASLSVLALRAGQPVFAWQGGQRRIDTAGNGPGQPATAATLYRIASISKMMTTIGVLRLREQGKLDLDRDVGDYLGYRLRNPHFPDQPVTLRSLLSHTSSLRDEAGYSWGADTAIAEVLTPGARLYGEGRMWASTAGPGAFFTYSNLNWGVIGTIMERVSGERFDLLMRRLLLQPLGLHGGYNPSAFTAEDVANTATLYRRRTTDTEIWNTAGPWIAQVDDFSQRPPAAPAGLASYVIGSNGTLFSPTGGLRISAADMGKVMQMLLNQGRHGDLQVLQPASVALMFSEQWRYNGGNGDTERGLFLSWGLGTQRFSEIAGQGNGLVPGGGFNGVGHLGEAYGLLSSFVLDPASGNGMVVLMGGVGADPEQYPGQYSALSRYEERPLAALYRRAILGRSD